MTRRMRLLLPLLLGVLLLACREQQQVLRTGDAAVVDAETPRDLALVVERLMPRLERLSGLDRLEPLRVRRQSREDARAFVERRLAEEMPPDELAAVRRTYVALGLLPDTLDLEALLLDLYTEQVIGYYDPGTTTLFIVSGEDVAELQPVIAHELVHALQDQHTNLDSLVARERGSDRQAAAHAAMEGHAMLVMFAVVTELATGRTVDPAALPNPAADLARGMDERDSAYPVFRRAPLVIRETLLFPYVNGVDFMHRLWQSFRPLARYPAPLDTLLPQSTAQILHPEELFIRVRADPVDIELPPPPAGWDVVRENGFGQLETGIYLVHHLGEPARSAARGWRGDRYRLLGSAAGVFAIQWLSVWEDDAAADRFAGAARRAAAARADRQISVTRTSHAGLAAVAIIDAPAGTDTTRVRTGS